MDKLKKYGLKKTKIRSRLVDVFEETNTFLCAEDVMDTLSDVTPSTIYRAFDSFVEAGLLVIHPSHDVTKTYYELAHEDHCHHLICTECHKVIHVHDCALHDYEKEVSASYGFEVTSHHLDLYGVCKECRK